jgi:uncharacterized membrane protein HdeD (DUF308 family)
MWDTVTQVVTKVFKSKTLILNWLTFAVGLLGYVAGQEVIVDHPQVVAVLVSVIAALNVVLRAVTFLPLDVKTSLNK